MLVFVMGAFAEMSVFSSAALGTSPSTARRTAAPTAQQCRRTRTTRTVTSSLTNPRGGATAPPRRAQLLLLLSVCCLDPIPPNRGEGGEGGAKIEEFYSPSAYGPSYHVSRRVIIDLT